MKQQFYYKKVANPSCLKPIIDNWRKTLLCPHDGMWESIFQSSSHIEIRYENETIGYAITNGQEQLLQLYLESEWVNLGPQVFEEFKKVYQISEALIGTNNPVYQELINPFSTESEVHTLLFQDSNHDEANLLNDMIRLAWEENLEKLVSFYHESTGAPEAWLTQYLGTLIDKGELFFVEREGEIAGSCEVRLSDIYEGIADIGMVVAPKFRSKGLGTYLLGKAKELAYDLGRKPICSCEAENTDSERAIIKNGFVSKFQILRVKL
ncbi:GNAT family N-acetyltransferase [Roseivirga sp.]|uniref:GNAT family N-acetyltransferase n=1 Tax=Roseivirga sp. TaxID=1964215 RepID=UPI003B8CED33